MLDEALANTSSFSSSFDPSSPSSSAALDAAVRAVPAAASPDAPYELGKALVALGRPEAALALLRARTKSSLLSSAPSSRGGGGSSSPPSSFEARLDEALTNLSARLECGLLSEAFTEARAAAARAAPVGSKEHAATARALTVALARWAADNGELPSVALFPLSGLEETALLDWLSSEGEEEEGAGRGDAVLQTVLFHLQRGRAPEALLAAAAAPGGKLVKSGRGGRGGNDPASAAAEAGAMELLRQASRSLPAAQRALVLLTPGSNSNSSLRLAGPGEPAPEGSLRLVREGLADVVPAARLLSLSGSKGGGGAGATAPPLLLSLTSEAWMERAGGGSAGVAAAAAQEEGGQGRQQKKQHQQKPSALRPRTRATTAAAPAATMQAWDWKGGGGASAAAHPAAPSVGGGFLAPVAALGTTTTKKARLQAVRL